MRFKVGQRFKYKNQIVKVVAVCDRPQNNHYCLVECQGGFSPPSYEAWYNFEGKYVTSGSINNLNKYKEYSWIFDDMVEPDDFINSIIMETE